MLEDILKDRDYMVGDKASYADLSFVVWNLILDLFPDHFSTWKTDYPKVAAWQSRLEERASVKKVKIAREAEIKKSA